MQNLQKHFNTSINFGNFLTVAKYFANFLVIAIFSRTTFMDFQCITIFSP